MQKETVLEDIVSEKEGKIIIDWQKLKKEYYGGVYYNDRLLREVFNHLEEKKLISKGGPKKGDYWLSCNNVSIDFSSKKNETDFKRYFFRREEDARGYVKAFWSDAVYCVYITQVVDIGNKDFDISRKY